MSMQVQTINEIRYRREQAASKRGLSVVWTTSRYSVGDMVRFCFNGKAYTGRITTSLPNGGVCAYHIETPSGAWYRGIDQQDIIGKA